MGLLDQRPLPFHHPDIRRLHEMLRHIYDDERSARLVLLSTGIPVAEVDWSGPMAERWHHVMEYASNDGRLRALVQHIRDDPHHDAWDPELDRILAAPADPAALDVVVIPTVPSPWRRRAGWIGGGAVAAALLLFGIDRLTTVDESGVIEMSEVDAAVFDPDIQATPGPPPRPSPIEFVVIPRGSVSLDGEVIEGRRAFEIQATEVTQGQWTQLMSATPSRFAHCGPSCPVERVSWYDAVAFLNAWSAAEGRAACYRLVDCQGQPGVGCPDHGACEGEFRCGEVEPVPDCTGYRLPTRDEWIRAALRDTPTRSFEPATAVAEAQAVSWFARNSQVAYAEAARCAGDPTSRCGPQPVKTRQATPSGLYDLRGNVWEWLADGQSIGGGWASSAETIGRMRPSTQARSRCEPDLGVRAVRDL